MASRLFILCCLCIQFQLSYSQLPKVYSGKFIRYPSFKSSHVEARNIDVWIPLPDALHDSVNVLYMHDGQMLFDSNTTWNKQEWGVDETITKLLNENKIRNCIVVGIWNTPRRRQEYFPEAVFNSLKMPLKDSIKKDIGGPPFSDDYLTFIVSELKPFIDSVFRISPNNKNTFIGGASMGGLISFYAMCRYPQIFKGAICMSTHWPGSVKRNEREVPVTFAWYAKNYLPSPNAHVFYFDYGTATLDAWYEQGQQLIDAMMRNAGYTDQHWITRKYDGANHSENAWKQRLHIPLTFILSK